MLGGVQGGPGQHRSGLGALTVPIAEPRAEPALGKQTGTLVAPNFPTHPRGKQQASEADLGRNDRLPCTAASPDVPTELGKVLTQSPQQVRSGQQQMLGPHGRSLLSLGKPAPVGEGVWPGVWLSGREGAGRGGQSRGGRGRRQAVGPASPVFEVELSTSSWQNHPPQIEWRPWPLPVSCLRCQDWGGAPDDAHTWTGQASWWDRAVGWGPESEAAWL